MNNDFEIHKQVKTNEKRPDVLATSLRLHQGMNR